MEYALEGNNTKGEKRSIQVLILVLMEYALEVFQSWIFISSHALVLILVLMEYALEAVQNKRSGQVHTVLILVLMEYALEAVFTIGTGPCRVVLILVLMEYALEVHMLTLLKSP